MILRPGPLNRVANAAPGMCIVALSVAALTEGAGVEKALVLVGLPGLVLSVRGYRLSAEIGPGKLVVHGLLRSRVIQRAAIVEVTDSSAVVWTDGSGRQRRTPVLAFNTQPGMSSDVAAHHAACLKRLRRWARKR